MVLAVVRSCVYVRNHSFYYRLLGKKKDIEVFMMVVSYLDVSLLP